MAYTVLKYRQLDNTSIRAWDSCLDYYHLGAMNAHLIRPLHSDAPWNTESDTQCCYLEHT